MIRTSVLAILLSLAVPAAAQVDEAAWITHYNGIDGWFAFEGPERVMELDARDFGLTYPVHVESLKAWFYWGMGSRTDTVITYKLYGGDGQTELWESESLTVPSTNWLYYGLANPVTIDSGKFYIGIASRTVTPWAYPHINVDDAASPQYSLFGTPGNWQVCTVGEYCFYAYVREVTTGVSEGRWVILPEQQRWPTVAGQNLFLPTEAPVQMLDALGRRVRRLSPGMNDTSTLPSGVYYLVATDQGTASRLVVQH